MRIFVVCLLLIAFVMLIAVPVSAQDRQLRQHHSIEIEVECLDAAMEIIRGLNGYNLESSVFSHETVRRGVERRAFITRRLDYWAFGHVQDVLRDMGDVLFETENAHFLGAQIMDADARIAALTQEIERLSIMLAASDSLDVLISIDARLSQVILERNSVIGTRNVLISQVTSPIININMFEISEGRPEVVPPRFVTRVTENFTASLRATGVVLSHLLVFLTRVSIPLLIYISILLVVVYIGFSIKKRQGKALALKMADTNISADAFETEPAEADETEGQQ